MLPPNVYFYLSLRDSNPLSPAPSSVNDNWPKKYRWFATGGVDLSSAVNTLTASTELMKHDDWTSNEFGSCETEIQLPGEIGLAGHCAIQINSVETAIIGGTDINNTVNNFVI